MGPPQPAPLTTRKHLDAAEGRVRELGTVVARIAAELRTEEDLSAFGGFAAQLMSEGRNEGETAVLAVAATMPAEAVLDDSVAHKAAQRAGLSCKRTLALPCDEG